MPRESERLYVYALAEPGLPRRFTVRGHRLQSLPLGDVSAVFERRGAPDYTVDAVRDQHDVITRLTQRPAAILPARFGSLADEASLRSLVASRRHEIRSALERVRGCRQMTIRIFGGADGLEPGPRPAAQSGTEFLERRRAGSKIVSPHVEAVRTELAPLVRAERVVADRCSGLLTVFHLVPTASLGRYRHLAARIGPNVAPRRVTVTGPWPVFAFTPELF